MAPRNWTWDFSNSGSLEVLKFKSYSNLSIISTLLLLSILLLSSTLSLSCWVCFHFNWTRWRPSVFCSNLRLQALYRARMENLTLLVHPGGNYRQVKILIKAKNVDDDSKIRSQRSSLSSPSTSRSVASDRENCFSFVCMQPKHLGASFVELFPARHRIKIRRKLLQVGMGRRHAGKQVFFLLLGLVQFDLGQRR